MPTVSEDVDDSRRGKNKRAFFTMVPNIVFDLDLPPLVLALYVYLIRTAGYDGKCWKSSRTLAKEMGCSVGTVSNAKRFLSTHMRLLRRPLIRIQKIPASHGGKPLDVITLTDIWNLNDAHFEARRSRTSDVTAKSKDDGANSSPDLRTSLAERAISPDELASSSVEIKKNRSKKILREEQTPSVSPSPRENEGDAMVEIDEFWKFLYGLVGRSDARGPTRSEVRLLKHWIPVPKKELEQVKWWMSLDPRDYYYKDGVGFMLRRRPISIKALLENWGSIGDVARHYFREWQGRGYLQ